jgi:hypothetical protein
MHFFKECRICLFTIDLAVSKKIAAGYFAGINITNIGHES